MTLFLIGTYSTQSWKAAKWSGVIIKRRKKRKGSREANLKEPKCRRCPLTLDLKPLRSCQRKLFYRQKIPEFSFKRKKAVGIDILKASKNGDRNIK